MNRANKCRSVCPLLLGPWIFTIRFVTLRTRTLVYLAAHPRTYLNKFRVILWHQKYLFNLHLIKSKHLINERAVFVFQSFCKRYSKFAIIITCNFNYNCNYYRIFLQLIKKIYIDMKMFSNYVYKNTFKASLHIF